MSTNPLIQDLIDNEAFPSSSIALPTGGRWYPDEMFAEGTDVNDLTIGVLGVLAEQNFRDPWLVLSGESIPRMLRTITPQILNPLDMCEVDLEAILIASRLVSFGPELQLEHKCAGPATDEQKAAPREKGEPELTTCGVENKIILDLNEFIQRYGPFPEEFLERYSVHIERVNQTVHLRPMPYRHVIELIKSGVRQDRQLKELDGYDIDRFITDPEGMVKYTQIVDMNSAASLDSIVAMIFAIESSKGEMVNGDDFIREWLLAMATDDIKLITDRSNELSREVRKRSEISYTCETCGHDNSMLLELDANRLFGQAGVSEPAKKPSQRSRNSGRPKKPR